MRFRKDYFISRRKKWPVQIKYDDYQLFLFRLLFFFGFGRNIGFFGAGGELDAAILSLRACKQEKNNTYKLNKRVKQGWKYDYHFRLFVKVRYRGSRVVFG